MGNWLCYTAICQKLYKKITFLANKKYVSLNGTWNKENNYHWMSKTYKNNSEQTEKSFLPEWRSASRFEVSASEV